jgi:hypothetical protein
VRIESVRGENGQAAPAPKPQANPEPHPLFRQAEQILSAKLVQIDDRFGVATVAENDDGPQGEEL